MCVCVWRYREAGARTRPYSLKYERQRDGGPSLAVEGASTARVLETYVEKVLVVASLRAGHRSW